MTTVPINFSNLNNILGYNRDYLSNVIPGIVDTSQIPGTQMPAFGAPNVGIAKTPALNTQGFNFGKNIPTVQMGIQGLATIANIWNAAKMASLARDQFNFTKDIGNANLLNSIKSYNTNLTDRATSRGVMQGQSAADVQRYIDANKLTR